VRYPCDRFFSSIVLVCHLTRDKDIKTRNTYLSTTHHRHTPTTLTYTITMKQLFKRSNTLSEFSVIRHSLNTLLHSEDYMIVPTTTTATTTTTTTTTTVITTTLPQQLQQEQEQYQEHCEKQCPTIREKLFYLSSIPNDQGAPLLEQLLLKLQPANQTEQQELSQILNNKMNTRNDCSLMHLCAKNNNTTCMELLHRYGTLIDAQDDLQATPLFYACAQNSQEAAAFLLSNGANPNHKDRYGSLPLSVCLRNNHLELMKILCLYNADIHLKTSRGLNCLHLAALEGDLNKVQHLITECKASIKRSNRDEEHVLFSALEHPHIVQYLCGTVEVKELMNLLSKTNTFGKTIFHSSCEKGALYSLIAIMRSLVDRMDSIDQAIDYLIPRLNESDSRLGYTPLIHSIVSNQSKITKFLLSCSDIELKEMDINGDTALHHAIYIKNEELCEELIQAGSSLKLKNNKQETCHTLIIQNDIKVNVGKLVEKKWGLFPIVKGKNYSPDV
jgi:ankyrin repeat protein